MASPITNCNYAKQISLFLSVIKDSRNTIAKLFSVQTISLINTKAILEKNRKWRYYYESFVLKKKKKNEWTAHVYDRLDR